jgi:hypothetical protein
MAKEEPMNRDVGRGVIVLVILLVAFILSGCTAKPRVIEISSKPISKPDLILPPARQLNLKEVEWVVINEENAAEVFAKLKEDKKDPVLIGLTDDGYEVLALNYSDIMAYIQQQNAIIKAYENYYVLSEEALDDANNEIESAKQEVESQNNTPQESIFNKLNPFN